MAAEKDKNDLKDNPETLGESDTNINTQFGFDQHSDPFRFWSAYSEQPKTCSSSKEHIEALRVWLNQYYVWSQSQWFQMTLPYYMMGYMAANQRTPGSILPAPGPTSSPQTPVQNQNQNAARQERNAQFQRPQGKPVALFS